MSRLEQKKLILRCVAYPKTVDGQDGFIAACIDLNLVAWRPKLQDARKTLMDAIQGYLETVSDLVKEEQDLKGLVPRRSSFWPFQAMYYIAVAQSALPKLPHRGESVRFEKPIQFPFSPAAA
jgi:hypothetical protein